MTLVASSPSVFSEPLGRDPIRYYAAAEFETVGSTT